MFDRISKFAGINQEKIIRNKFTIISFLCSIFVIYIHAFNLEVYKINDNSVGIDRITYIIENYFSLLLEIAVPSFFLISGVLFFRTFEIKKLLKKWKSRIFTILIPYLIWCTLYYLFFVVLTNVPMIKSKMNSEIIQFSFSNWINSLWVDEFYLLWFLKNLIVFILLTPIIWVVLKNHNKKIPTGFIALIVLLSLFVLGVIDFSYSEGLEFYLVGSYIGINCRELIKYKNKIISIVSLIFIVFVMGSLFTYWNSIVKIFFILAIWYALDLTNLSDIELPWWTKITFFTYVAHEIPLEIFEKIILVLGGNRPIIALLDYLFIPIVVEIFLIISAYIFRKCTPNMWNIITGDRENRINDK